MMNLAKNKKWSLHRPTSRAMQTAEELNSTRCFLELKYGTISADVEFLEKLPDPVFCAITTRLFQSNRLLYSKFDSITRYYNESNADVKKYIIEVIVDSLSTYDMLYSLVQRE